MTTTLASRPSLLRRAGSFAVRALKLELGIYAAIGRAIARRKAIPKGAVGLPYHQPVMTLLIIFIVLSAIEIPIVDLIVHQWPAVRIAFLILGIWGVTWMIGLLCAFLMRPHTVGPDGVRVREGIEIDIPLTWDDVLSIERAHRVDEPKSPRFEGDGDERTLVLRMQDETNILITLERPTAVRLPGVAPKGGVQVVSAVRLWTDDPTGYLDAVRTHMP